MRKRNPGYLVSVIGPGVEIMFVCKFNTSNNILYTRVHNTNSLHIKNIMAWLI